MNSTTTSSAPMRQHRPRRPMGGGPGGHHGGPHDGKPSYRSQRGDPPPGYVCHRCHVSGHWIQDCPTNGDPKFDKKHRSQNMRCNLPGLLSVEYVESVWCGFVWRCWFHDDRMDRSLCVSMYWLLCVVYRVSRIFLLPIFAMYCRFGCDSFVKLISYFEALFSGNPSKSSLPTVLSHYEGSVTNFQWKIRPISLCDVIPMFTSKAMQYREWMCCDLIYWLCFLVIWWRC